MSRIGKKLIQVPDNVKIEAKDRVVKIKGPKGELSLDLPPNFSIEQNDGMVAVRPKKEIKSSTAIWGLTSSLLSNCIEGVSNGFEKSLEIIGVGYKASVKGKELDLSLGFSHPVKLEVPDGIECSVEKNIIKISGINKQKVGQFAAKIRAVRKPEPYKGKGVRYLGEHVRRKEGKKAGATA